MKVMGSPMNRRRWMLALGSATAACASRPGEFALISPADFEPARRKVEKHAWTRAVYTGILSSAEQATGRPLELPDRGGQWGSWYSCKRDGVPLVTLSATEHRCPTCGAVYRGYPYDEVVIARVHGQYATDVRQCGLAYGFIQDRAFARRAADILLAYAARYNSYPRHDQHGKNTLWGGRITAQTLNESQLLISFCMGYSLIRETLSAAERRRIEAGLLLPAAELIREHKMGVHNIQCWKNSGVGIAGFVLGNQDLVYDAIDDPERGFRAQIAKGVTDDGLWYEGSLGYHHYTMSALWQLAEAARHAGIDLYSDRYRSMFDAPLALAFPNGDAPGFNDGGGLNVVRYAPLYELAYARWKRPEYGHVAARGERNTTESLFYGVETLPVGPLIPEASALLASAGFAVLRAPGIAAAMRFGLHGGGHGHPDKLNLVTYGGGRQFGVDAGSINYGVPLYFEWYRTTIAHNTVCVDESPQARVDGRLQDWRAGSDGTTLEASAGPVYPGVDLRRTVTLHGRRLSDTFVCSSEAEHTYDWAFHAIGQLTCSLDLESLPGRLGVANGYQHIEQVRCGEASGDWWAQWVSGGARCVIEMKGEPGTVVYEGVAPGPDPRERIAMIVVRRRGRSTVFRAEHRFQ